MITLKSGKKIELNQAFNCDCLEFMKELPDKCIDLTVTSPPYDNLRTYNNSLEWNEDIWKAIIKDLFRITKDGGVVVWVVGDATINGSETGTSFKQALFAMDCGFSLHDTMIYEKENPMPSNQNRYSNAFEYMFVFSKGKPKAFNPLKEACKHAGKKATGTIIKKDGDRVHKKAEYYNETKYRSNIFTYSVGNNSSTDHPAVFPYYLAVDNILSWSNNHDLIFEPFCGSFTTPTAANKNKRNWLGCEKDPDYFKSGYHRYEQETKQLLMEF